MSVTRRRFRTTRVLVVPAGVPDIRDSIWVSRVKTTDFVQYDFQAVKNDAPFRGFPVFFP